jgi:hypothetical protein
MSRTRPSASRSDGVVAPPAPGTALPPARAAATPGRVVLTHDDLLWFKTSQDDEGRLTLGLLECSRESIGVLVDDDGEALGLLLTRAEAQDLHRALVAWLAGTTRTAAA